MKGHDQYLSLINSLSKADESLIEVLDQTAIIDVSGADEKPMPEETEQRVALMKKAAKEGITAILIAKWALVFEGFIVHMERLTLEGKTGCKARLIVIADGGFYYCPIAAFIPDDWSNFGPLEWEKTDCLYDHIDSREDVATIITLVLQGATALRDMLPETRLQRTFWLGSNPSMDREAI